MTDELVGKTITNPVVQRLIMYSYLKDDGYIVKTVTSTKRVC